MFFSLIVLALVVSVQGRAVNISNTWMLPEEGFPVFYRYFRDRISWYEADAVCQFHHANLVTVDTTAQYDAVRAYLKELDISSPVWVGLIRSNPDGDFTWTDYRGLSNEGYWSSAPDSGSAPLCAAADPAADYRWEARACGGPMVASFICELPVPQWASGAEGCMIKALPALTILYLPESASVQLTNDCGPSGVKRVQCTGNMKREELLKDLACSQEVEDSTLGNEIPTGTSESVETDGSTTPEFADTTEEQTTIESRTHITDETSTVSTSVQIENITPRQFIHVENPVLIQQNLESDNTVYSKNIHDDNNLESNDISKLPIRDNWLDEQNEKLEDEKRIQRKMLHEELAKIGNSGLFEKIFTQSSDHFVPPLVMAKARESDDLAEMSIGQKYAQQIAEQNLHREKSFEQKHVSITSTESSSTNQNVKTTMEISTSEIPIVITTQPYKEKQAKPVISKKYKEKYNDSKMKKPEKVSKKRVEKVVDATVSEDAIKTTIVTDGPATTAVHSNKTEEESPIELTVTLKEVDDTFKAASNVVKINNFKSDDKITPTPTTPTQENISTEHIDKIVELIQENINVTIPNAKDPSTPIVFEVTTLMPIFIDPQTTDVETVYIPVVNTSTEIIHDFNNSSVEVRCLNCSVDLINSQLATTVPNEQTTTATNEKTKTKPTIVNNKTFKDTSDVVPKINNEESVQTTTFLVNITDTVVEIKKNDTESSEENDQHIDDQNSPLLSEASEPLHRPSRLRRPQQPQNRLKKFNPFRILG